jgi:hypothetical protein
MRRATQGLAYAWLALGLAACGATAATAPDGGSDVDAAPAGAPTCADYCAAIEAACIGTHQQYSDRDDCMASCTAFPVGAAGDSTGDTLGCRLSHARDAARDLTVCPQAGPGGDGVCGDSCGGYCDIAMKFCTDANAAKIYDTRAACLADCATRMSTVKLNAGSPDRTDLGNEVACVLYHVQMGAVAPGNHCLGDLALTADTCRATP